MIDSPKLLRLARLFEIGDNVLTILGLLETGKNHLVSLDKLFRIFEPLHDIVIVPSNSGFLIGS